MRKKLFAVLIVVILCVAVWLLLRPENTITTSNPTQYSPFNKSKYSLSKPDSLWVVVNKKRSLPSDYTPRNLRYPNVKLRSSNPEMQVRDDAATALEQMATAAKKAGVPLMLASGYRPYSLQEAVYNNYVAQDGETAANRYSAKPGHSEHQTGLAIDLSGTDGVCVIEDCFKDTKTAKWLAKNAHTYGYILRYEPGKEAIVGYTYEPWHFRYVGVPLATEIYQNKTTMEQFFQLPAAPDYN